MSKSNIPVKTENLYELKIPGGVARFWKTDELSPRRRRELATYTSYLSPKLRELSTASSVSVGGVVADTSDVLADVPVGLSLSEHRELLEMTNIAAWTYLKSWTLRRDGQPVPVPVSAEEFWDVPPAIYDAIAMRAAKIMVSSESEFTVAAVEDPESPTGA